MADVLIQTEELSRAYQLGDNEVRALRGVSLAIAPGEFVAVMGPSGSGKSTFMNLVGCLDRPTGGAYWLDNENVAELDTDALAAIRNSKIGFVFQTFNLLARTSALQNVEMPLLYSGASAAARRDAATARLTDVGLAERMDHTPSQLSGGQQQRVAIARALVNDPVLVLADEPTGALDSRTGVEIMAIFQDLNAAGITIVIVTHEPDIARYAKRVVTFRDGVVTDDEPVTDRLSARDILEEWNDSAEAAL
jgi:putative ABC transport system ATP-binding protein